MVDCGIGRIECPMKTQTVRLLDVFFIGPYMIWSSGKLKGPHRELMRALGVATIVYNGVNWLRAYDAGRTQTDAGRS